MNFFRPVPGEYPVSCLYRATGSIYPWHIDESSGLWLKGRKCSSCNTLEPCTCPNPMPLGNHPGTDFSCPEDTRVYAIADGLIIRSGQNDPNDESNGLRLVQLISHMGYDNWWVTYRHLRLAIPHIGRWVKRGERIGYSGMNGSAYLCVELLDRNMQFQPITFDE